MGSQSGFIYFGTYSDGKSNGIYGGRRDGGAFSPPRLLAELRHASWLHATPDGFLLACSELSGKDGAVEGRLVSYRMEDNGALSFVSTLGTQGLSPCHIAYAPRLRLCAVSNYADGMLALYRLSIDGELTLLESICLMALHASPGGVSHAHCALFTQEATALLVSDLGQDSVFRFSVEGEAAEKQPFLRREVRFALPEGCGPRHLVLVRDEQRAYVVCELSNELIGINPSSGDILVRFRLTDDSFAGFAAASALRAHPDQTMLAASCRGNDKVVIFGLDASGGVSWRTDHSLPHSYPRDIAFDPAGDALWVAYERSAVISRFQLMSQGKLRHTGDLFLSSPVSICFANSYLQEGTLCPK